MNPELTIDVKIPVGAIQLIIEATNAAIKHSDDQLTEAAKYLPLASSLTNIANAAMQEAVAAQNAQEATPAEPTPEPASVEAPSADPGVQ